MEDRAEEQPGLYIAPHTGAARGSEELHIVRSHDSDRSSTSHSELDTQSVISEAMTEASAQFACVDDDFARINWYHGRLSRHHASSLLMQNGKDGYFLLRQSEHTPGQLTLSVRGLESVKHFNIMAKDGCYSMSRTIVFNSAPEFIKYFEAQPVISGESGVLTQLTQPYPRKVEEFVDYDQVRILTPFKTMALSKPADVDLSVVSKEGYLTKLGRIHKSWKTRWFVLWKDHLKYYKDRGATESLGSVDLTKCTAVERTQNADRLHCFSLIGPKRTLVMFASTQAEMDGWVNCLQWKLDFLGRTTAAAAASSR